MLGIRMAELLTLAEGVAVLIRDGDIGLPRRAAMRMPTDPGEGAR
jgi:hypothetical protein